MEKCSTLEINKEVIISAEDFVEKLNKTLDEADYAFFEKYNRYPNLDNEEDYALLGDFLDISEQYDAFDNIKIQGSACLMPGGHCASHDMGVLLLKRFLKRAGFFAGNEQQKIFEAILGNRNYNASKEEYVSRIKFIKDLEAHKIPFPNNWEEFVEKIKKIKQICFLKESYRTNQDVYLRGYKKIGTHLVNPTGSALLFLKNIKSWKDLIKKYEEFSFKLKH